ncbi:MAG TPA: pinensin family lanthipeptide [Longimicrobium sp.]|jgi:hypothetical protein
MQKLKLKLDDLQVESFPTADGGAKGKGTVKAHDVPTYWLPGCWTAPDYGSTCEPVYTCPECASPPETQYQCAETDLCEP